LNKCLETVKQKLGQIKEESVYLNNTYQYIAKKKQDDEKFAQVVL